MLARDEVSDGKAIQRKAAKKSQSQACQAVAIVSSVFSFMIGQERFGGTNTASRVQKSPPPSRGAADEEAKCLSSPPLQCETLRYTLIHD